MSDATHAKFSAEDLSAIEQLPSKAAEKLKLWFGLLAPLMPSPTGERVKQLTERLSEIAVKEGVSAPSVRRRYDALRHDGWRGLVDRSLTGPTWQNRKAVAPAFKPKPRRRRATKAQMLERSLADFERRSVTKSGLKELPRTRLHAIDQRLTALREAVADALKCRARTLARLARNRQ